MITYNGLTFEPYITKEQIAQMVNQVAQRISADYAGRTPHLICVLNGAVFYAADLMRALTIDCTMSFIQLRSYQGTETTGQVEEVQALDKDLSNQDVIVIEDIVDTGITLHYLKERLLALKPRSLKTTALLFKPSKLQHEDARPDYYGKEIPEAFVIGYGLDLDGLARNLPEIYSLKQ